MSKLGTDPSGRRVDAVHVERRGEQEIYSADTVVVACGSLSSALLLLRSANDRHPNGLANGSDQVGRNYMRHEMSIVMAVMRHANETVFQKTLAFSDFYFGSDDWDYPARPDPDVRDQPCGSDQGRSTAGLARVAAEHAVQRDRAPFDGFLAAVRRPAAIPTTAIYYKDGKVHLDLAPTNPEALKHLKRKLKEVLSEIGWPAVLLERSLYLGKNIPLSRHRASGGHLPLRHGSRDVGAGPRLPRARGR